MEFAIHFLFSYLSTVTFGILTNVPRRGLHLCGLAGSVGWMIFWITQQANLGNIFANFLGSIGIGTMSILFSRMKRMPMTMFNIPALVPLVPGGLAYQAMRHILLGDYISGAKSTIAVILTAGAIASGFLITGIIERLIKKFL